MSVSSMLRLASCLATIVGAIGVVVEVEAEAEAVVVVEVEAEAEAVVVVALMGGTKGVIEGRAIPRVRGN